MTDAAVPPSETRSQPEALPPPKAREQRTRRPTATASFGSSRRESHDASAFYQRFVPPVLSADTDITRPELLDVIHHSDARDMGCVPANSVALVVTSPPYFAGKEYELTLGADGVPATYFEYLAMLRDVFEECRRVLEPGGRMAVNVANLGRRPFRSLAGDVTEILQDLGLLLRGEVVWWKGRAAGGSCAWGSFQNPANPVLRDVTERIVMASKDRFDRALGPIERQRRGLPATATISRDEFLEATTDLWEMPTESAARVGHPAPFPVALPQRVIDLYTYEGDVVLDPFMGAGSTAVAAVRTGRHYIGFDTDAAYVRLATERVGAELRLWPPSPAVRLSPGVRRSSKPRPPAGDPGAPGDASRGAIDDVLAEAVREGKQAKEVAAILLGLCGFVEIRANVKPPGTALKVSFMALDQMGGEWAFDLSGAFTSIRGGLHRTDTLWRALGQAAVLNQLRNHLPLVLLTTNLPARGSSGAAFLGTLRGSGLPVFDVVEILAARDHARLRRYAVEGRTPSTPRA